jgi:uncharacterized HAD superfamily protein
MEYRNFNDLNRAITDYLPDLPRDLDLVVGVPRSGMLAANILALHLNIPYTDLDGYIEGRVIGAGRRPMRSPGEGGRRKVLVVDDSVLFGTQMREARRVVGESGTPDHVIFGAVYVTPESRHLVDVGFETVPSGRCFAWNAMHHPFLGTCCVDIDGVLCSNPTPEENDDGPRYRRFLETARPLFVPTVEIGWLVTGRLEKYRPETEAWLRAHGVKYRHLLMLDLPSATARREAGGATPFKSQSYLKTDATLFIESSYNESVLISRATGKPVLSVETQEMINPSFAYKLSLLHRRNASGVVKRIPRWIKRRVWGRIRNLVRA